MRLYLSALFILSLTAFADQIVMKNGDRVTGSIIKKDAAQLTVKSVHFGTVILPWNEIESVKSDKPLTVELSNKKSVEGPIASSGDKIVIGSNEPVAPKDIVAIRNADEQKTYLRNLHPRLTELWTINGTIGFAGTAGNARTHTFTVPINLVRATRNDKLEIHFNLIRSGATVNGVSSPTASAVRGGFSYNRNLAPKFFVALLNDYEQDRFQNLNLRTVAGGGLGWHAWKRDRGFIDLTAGSDFNHESFSVTSTTLPFSRSLAEAYWGNNLSWKLNKRITFTEAYRMFNVLTPPGAYRQNGDFTMSMSVTKYFTWNASLSDRYLSNPPLGLKKNDFLYSTGLGFKFAK